MLSQNTPVSGKLIEVPVSLLREKALIATTPLKIALIYQDTEHGRELAIAHLLSALIREFYPKGDLLKKFKYNLVPLPKVSFDSVKDFIDFLTQMDYSSLLNDRSQSHFCSKKLLKYRLLRDYYITNPIAFGSALFLNDLSTEICEIYKDESRAALTLKPNLILDINSKISNNEPPLVSHEMYLETIGLLPFLEI